MPRGPTSAVDRSGAPLVGRLSAPGDASVSQLAVVLALLAVGTTTIEGLAESDDVLRTARACAALGARVERAGPGSWRVAGVGVGGLLAPAAPLDAGGCALAAALLAAAAGSHPVRATIDGDAGLRARPMTSLLEPLARMGAVFEGQEGQRVASDGLRLPLTLTGPQEAIPVAAPGGEEAAGLPARTAWALLVAGLNSPGRTTVIAPEAACDDAVALMRLLGAQARIEPHGAGTRAVSLEGQPELRGTRVRVPADPFVSACAVLAALISPGSDLLVETVAAARLDAGLLPILRDMGADVAVAAERGDPGPPVADLRVRASRLAGIAVPAARAASLGADIPLLAVAAAAATGETRVGGVDTSPAVLDGLAAAGVEHAREGDVLVVRGNGLDPRTALARMLAHVLRARDPSRPAAGAVPTFASLLRELGATLEEAA